MPSTKSEFWITASAFVHNHAGIILSSKDGIPVSIYKLINTEYRAKFLLELEQSYSCSRTELLLERRNLVE